MKYVIGLMFWMVGTAGFAQTQKDIQWMDFEELGRVMETRPKKVLLFFHEEGCAYCRKMERSTFKNEDVVEELNKGYYAVEMDAHATDTIYLGNREFVNSETEKSRFPVHQLAALFIKRKGYPVSFPVTVLLDENFQIIDRSFVYLSPKAMQQFINP